MATILFFTVGHFLFWRLWIVPAPLFKNKKSPVRVGGAWVLLVCFA
jgi:hypothetical protein